MGVVFQLLAEVLDVHVDGAAPFVQIAFRPQSFPDAVPAHGLTGPGCEQKEQIEFRVGEVQFLAVLECNTPRGIDLNVFVDQGLGRDRAWTPPPQTCLDSGGQLQVFERFDQIIVRSGFQAEHLVCYSISRGKHDDRNVGLFSDRTADLDAVYVREKKIQDNERGVFVSEQAEGFSSGGRGQDRVSVPFQVVTKNGEDVRVIIHDEYLFSFHVHFPSGKVKQKQLPLPGWLSTQMLPL